MASINPASTTAESPVHIKIAVNGTDENRKFKLSLKDCYSNVLPDKLRNLLQVSSTQHTVFERYSDSSSSFITLDSSNPSVYKQLFRAAKAKGKLRIRVTITDIPSSTPDLPQMTPALPERLTTRCYVHPYISDPSNYESIPSARLSTLVDLKTASEAPSTTTLTPTTNSKVEPQASTKMSESKQPYFWPISDNPEWSQPAKSTFQKDPKQTAHEAHEALRQLHNDIAARNASNVNAVPKAADPEAPLPRYFSAREHCRAELAGLQQPTPQTFALRPKPCANFTICCNNCDGAIPDAHWHCSICDDGDFDLCQDCVESGYSCDNEEHWLIKRSVEDGKVVASTTETIAPKAVIKTEEEKEIPGAFTSDTKAETIEEGTMDLSRTCNQCVQVYDESKFVTCTVCEDFDLCVPCHIAKKHGHHPSHGFVPASGETSLGKMATDLLAPGRNERHYAICDGCNKGIYGVRHKCLHCPDWDYCSTCHKASSQTHPGHTFVPVYEQIKGTQRTHQKHVGIYCDGDLCEGKGSYIVGDRYKCAVCHDTDFCATCEALPRSTHNRTHPLIKFKTPVRGVTVSTGGSKADGSPYPAMGDQQPHTSSKATETNAPASSANAATQVQTVAEVKPVEATIKEQPKEKSIKPADLAAELNAHFVKDVIPDGAIMAPGSQFFQAWDLHNPGPHAWPAGCSVCFVGGDGMLDVDPNHPSHITQIHNSIKTNTIEHEVKVGEEASFKVAMRAPEREGKAISYWRLKANDGTPFGHKLWCDINVQKPTEEQMITTHIEDIAEHQPKVEVEADSVAKGRDPAASKMIFPKLDKESPVSSVTADAPETVSAPVPAPVDDLLDVESLELDDDEESDEGFLTDEEYELVASDNDLEEAKNGKK